MDTLWGIRLYVDSTTTLNWVNCERLWQKGRMQTQENKTGIERWGLSLEEIMGLEGRLSEYYDRYRVYLMTQQMIQAIMASII